MRKYGMSLRVALESANSRDSDVDYQRHISLEEEMMMRDEASDAAGDVEQGLGEFDRIADISDAMEDLAEIAGGIENLSDTEAALMDTASNMAVAGSDQPSEEIVPCMEAFIGGRIATESIETIKERAKKIWESIMKFLADLWKKITEFFYNTFSQIPNIRKRIEAMKETAKALGNHKPNEPAFDMKAISKVMVGGKMPSNVNELASGFGELVKECENVFGKYLSNVVNVGKAMANAIGAFDAKKPEESMKNFVTKISPFVARPKQGLFDVSIGKELMGGFHMQETAYQSRNDSIDAQMEAIRKARVEFVGSETANKSTGVKFTTLTPSDIIKVMDEAEVLLSVLENYKRGASFKAIESVKNEIGEASKRANTSITSLNETGPAATAAMSTYQQMLNFNAVFARWIQSPAIQLCRSSLMTVNGLVEVANQSVSQYKGSEAEGTPLLKNGEQKHNV